MINVCRDKCLDVANIFRKMRFHIADFTDERFFPGENDDLEDILRFFFFAVAIDHRTRIKGFKYAAVIDGVEYKGADLLFKLLKDKYDEDPGIFDPANMMKITPNDIISWLNIGNAVIWDPETRAFLLRDAGFKLVKLYDGRVKNLIDASGGRVGGISGFLGLIKVFRAYEDPVEKKAFLLLKFLLRRRLYDVKDPGMLQVPVDNHLTRIAVRLGLVRPSKELIDVFRWKRKATFEEDVIIRLQVRRAYKLVALKAGLDPLVMDDLLWTMGRSCCRVCCVNCNNCRIPVLDIEGCPFKEVCDSYATEIKINEHLYEDTWYY